MTTATNRLGLGHRHKTSERGVPVAAEDVTYSNTGSGMAADQVQEAIDELDTAVAAAVSGAAAAVHGHAATELTGVGRIIGKAKPADESVTSSTTLQFDDDLVFTVAANEIWVVDYTLMIDGDPAGDVKFAFAGPSGARIDWGSMSSETPRWDAMNPSSAPNALQTISGTLAFGCAAAGTRTGILLRAVVTNAANAGDVTLRWAQNSSFGTPTTLLKGCSLFAMRTG